MSRYEADLAVFVISFIPSSMGVYAINIVPKHEIIHWQNVVL